MLTTAALITLLMIGEVNVDVARLDGERLSGQLQSISAEEIVISTDGQSQAVPISELKDVRPNSTEAQPAAPTAVLAHITVTLRDGSLLLPSELTASATEAIAVSPVLGELRVPKASVANVRLARADQKLTDAWQALLEREHRDDLVVVRKGDALDHVEGVVGSIDDKAVNLLLDGQSIPIPRGRVFGVIYAAIGATPPKPLCRFELADGQQLSAAGAKLEDRQFTIDTNAGGTVTIPAEAVERIDFSLGKIRSLADMEPTSVDYPADLLPQLENVWRYRRGQNSRGRPLVLGGRTYDDGLWIHSGTTLRFRLGREYHTLKGVMGIDEDIGDCAPQVGVVIRGDGRVLLETELRREDEPQQLDLNVENVRELEIEVVSHDPDGICEHLDLVEARLIK